jgi:AcrR family transcriptional regulator
MNQAERNVTHPTRVRRPKRQEVRARLIDGAMKAFAAKGFAGASIDFICEQAGFSRGAFYSNFEDKDALFFALYDLRTDRLYARLTRLAEAAQQVGDPLALLVEELRKPDEDELKWDILNKEFIVHALRNDAARQRLLASREGSKTRLAEILLTLRPDLSQAPEKLDRLSRIVIALHEGELTQLGLDPALKQQSSLLADVAVWIMARD